MHLVAPTLQALGHQIAGRVFLVGQFGLRVDLAADVHHFGFVRTDLVQRGWQQWGVYVFVIPRQRKSILRHILRGPHLLENLPMSDLSAFPITSQWPAKHPDRLQLYSMPTPNGVKVSIMLEEIGLPYEAHRVAFDKNEQLTPEFLSLNPNNKIPAILDPQGPGGKPLALFESGAILVYLADKTGKLMPSDPAARYGVLQWLMFQMGGIGPMFGQLGFFHKFAGKDYEDKRPRDRYVAESARLLGVLEKQLGQHTWVAGADYSIADIAIWPWASNLVGFYGAGELVQIERFPLVEKAIARFVERPAVAKGLTIPSA